MRLYSEAKLTYKEDKCVALAGLVQELSHYFGDEYVAGHW